jgi:hypothetical protein
VKKTRRTSESTTHYANAVYGLNANSNHPLLRLDYATLPEGGTSFIVWWDGGFNRDGDKCFIAEIGPDPFALIEQARQVCSILIVTAAAREEIHRRGDGEKFSKIQAAEFDKLNVPLVESTATFAVHGYVVWGPNTNLEIPGCVIDYGSGPDGESFECYQRRNTMSFYEKQVLLARNKDPIALLRAARKRHAYVVIMPRALSIMQRHGHELGSIHESTARFSESRMRTPSTSRLIARIDRLCEISTGALVWAAQNRDEYPESHNVIGGVKGRYKARKVGQYGAKSLVNEKAESMHRADAEAILNGEVPARYKSVKKSALIARAKACIAKTDKNRAAFARDKRTGVEESDGSDTKSEYIAHARKLLRHSEAAVEDTDSRHGSPFGLGYRTYLKTILKGNDPNAYKPKGAHLEGWSQARKDLASLDPMTEARKSLVNESAAEYVVWGVPPGGTRGDERILLTTIPGKGVITNRADAERAVKVLKSKGCSELRIQAVDGSAPDFSGTVRRTGKLGESAASDDAPFYASYKYRPRDNRDAPWTYAPTMSRVKNTRQGHADMVMKLGRKAGGKYVWQWEPSPVNEARKSRKSAYDQLAISPAIVARTVATRPYTGNEISQGRGSNEIASTEALRRDMTPAQTDEFVELVDNLCRGAYESSSPWMLKITRSSTNAGRDQLYTWASHWLASYLNNPAILRRDARRVKPVNEVAGYALKDGDKRVVKAWIQNKPAESKWLSSDGTELRASGSGVMAKWANNKPFVGGAYGNVTQTLVNFIRKELRREGMTTIGQLDPKGQPKSASESVPYRTINDAGKTIPDLSEGTTEVWFSRARTLDESTITASRLHETHALVGKVKCTSPDRLFVLLQEEKWSPRGEARSMLQARGVVHSSLSVGDVVVTNGRHYMVATDGFKRLDK